jgi:hypothetical protein
MGRRRGPGNIAAVAQQALINSLRADDELLEGQVRVYRFHLAAGTTWRFAVDALAGDPDLYVWNAAGVLVGYSNSFDLTGEAATITAAQSGFFQVEVHGYRDSRYTLHVQSAAVATDAVASNESKPLPTAPVVAPASIPTGQQALPTVPEASTQSIFLPVTLR